MCNYIMCIVTIIVPVMHELFTKWFEPSPGAEKYKLRYRKLSYVAVIVYSLLLFSCLYTHDVLHIARIQIMYHILLVYWCIRILLVYT